MSTQIRGNKQIKNITIQNGQIADGTIELDKLREGSELIKRDGSVAVTGDFDFDSHQIKNLAAPTDDNDAVRKADLDAVTNGSSIFREIPSGTINGTNTNFVLANTPNLGTEQVFINGSLLNAGANSDYVLDGSTVTFTIAPQVGDVVLVNYITDAVVVSLDITNTLNQFNSRLTTTESELFTAQGDITSVQGDVAGIDTRLSSAEGDITSVEGDVSSLQSSLSSLQSSVSTLQSGLSDEQDARIAADDALDMTVSSIQTSVTSLGNRMNTTESDIVALESADATFDLRAGVIEDGLQAETTARTNADNALSSRVTTLENKPDPVAALSELTDVTITSPASNQVLQYNGTKWVNGAAPSTFSGSYNDLTNKPNIPSLTQVEADIADHESRLSTIEGNAFVTREIPSGLVNGSNTSFSLANTPMVGSEQVYVNGMLQEAGSGNDYTISNDTITFAEAPLTGWKIHVSYATGSYSVAPAGMGGSNFSGSYNDLTNKPSIPSLTQVEADIADHELRIASLEEGVNTVDVIPSIDQLSGVAITSASNGQVLKYNGSSWINASDNTFSGSYNDLSDKPSIPSLSGYATESYVNNKVADLVNSAPSTLDTLNELATALGNDANFSTTMTNALAAKASTSSLAAVATSGSYTDLINKPTLFDGAYSSLTGKPSFATVATSGSYNDLSNKPTIPSTITDDTTNSFNTSLVPSSGTLTFDVNSDTLVLGALSASVTTWAFTNVSASNNKATTISVVLEGNASKTYGDACSVNGVSVSGGIKWSGGIAPTASGGVDVITFTIIKDASGSIKVLGSSSVNFI